MLAEQPPAPPPPPASLPPPPRPDHRALTFVAGLGAMNVPLKLKVWTL